MKYKSEESQSILLLILIALTSFINPFMGAAVNIALPDMANEFSMNAMMMGWVTMSFLLASVAILLPVGKLADITGRRRIFILGNIVLTIASALCALAVNSSMLIVFRVLQGLGGAMMFGTGTAMITSAFPAHRRGRALGINVSAVYLGLTLAPLIGGFMTDMFGWRSIFWLNVPFGLIVIPATFYAIKTEWRDAHGEKFDVQGSLIYFISITVLMYGISKLPEIYALVLVASGIAGMVFFIKTELGTPSPVLNIRLFTQNRVFAYSNLAALINYAATFAVTFMLSLFLQYIKGMKAADAGLLLVTQPVLMTIMASLSGRLSDKFEPRLLSSAGMALIVIGLVMLVFLGEHTHNAYITTSLFILGTGFGLFSAPNTNAVMSSVEKRYLGVASATIGTMRLAGQMISMAIATLVLHAWLGDVKISDSAHLLFVNASRITFAVFAILCFFGVFASLARGNQSTE